MPLYGVPQHQQIISQNLMTPHSEVLVADNSLMEQDENEMIQHIDFQLMMKPLLLDYRHHANIHTNPLSKQSMSFRLLLTLESIFEEDCNRRCLKSQVLSSRRIDALNLGYKYNRRFAPRYEDCINIFRSLKPSEIELEYLALQSEYRLSLDSFRPAMLLLFLTNPFHMVWLDKTIGAIAEAAPHMVADTDSEFASRVALILKHPGQKKSPRGPEQDH